MRNLILVAVAVSISGCAATSPPRDRFTMDDVWYSLEY